MSLLTSKIAGLGLVLFLGTAGCGMVHAHIDCDQVSQHQRSGETDEDIARATGFNVSDVQSCSQTTASSGRETANNYQDQPRLPVIPSFPAGSFGAVGSF